MHAGSQLQLDVRLPTHFRKGESYGDYQNELSIRYIES
jgi:hypothetical protein